MKISAFGIIILFVAFVFCTLSLNSNSSFTLAKTPATVDVLALALISCVAARIANASDATSLSLSFIRGLTANVNTSLTVVA